MSNEPLPSWKSGLAVAALLLILVNGYELVFGHGPAERIAQIKAARIFSWSEPSADALDRQIISAPVYVSVGYTLRELVERLKSRGVRITWEPMDERNFITRFSHYDQLTRTQHETAVRFVLVDGPHEIAPNWDGFSGKAVAAAQVVRDGIVLSPDEMTVFMYR